MKRPAWVGLLAAFCLVSSIVATEVGYRAGLRDANRARPAMSAVVEEAESNPLTAFRTEREELRQRQSAQLNDIIYTPASDGETVRLAQRQMLSLLEAEATETRLEGLLESRGFKGALVDAGGDAVNVMVRAETLTRQQSAVILELVMRETGVTGGNVKIIPVN